MPRASPGSLLVLLKDGSWIGAMFTDLAKAVVDGVNGPGEGPDKPAHDDV